MTSAIPEWLGGGRGQWSFAGIGDVGGDVVGNFWNGAENTIWIGIRVKGRVVASISFFVVLVVAASSSDLDSFHPVSGQNDRRMDGWDGRTDRSNRQTDGLDGLDGSDGSDGRMGQIGRTDRINWTDRTDRSDRLGGLYRQTGPDRTGPTLPVAP